MTISALATQLDISLHAGNDVPITVNVTGNDGEPVWLDTWTSKFIISSHLTARLTLTSENGDIDHYPATDDINQIVIHIDADDTRAWTDREFDYELKLNDGNGHEETALYGKLTFTLTADREGA